MARVPTEKMLLQAIFWQGCDVTGRTMRMEFFEKIHNLKKVAIILIISVIVNEVNGDTQTNTEV